MKKHFSAAAAVAGLASLAGAYYFKGDNVTSGFLSGLSGNLITLGLGILIVNYYMENKSKKSAVMVLLAVTQNRVGAFHNHWLSLCWAHFGKDRFSQIFKEYVGSGGKPYALSEETRREIYRIYTEDQAMQKYLANLDESLSELSRLAGWSLSPEVLEKSLTARLAISQLREVALDDSIESHSGVTENMLDADVASSYVLKALMDVAGVPFKDLVA